MTRPYASLAEWVDARGPLSPREAALIALDVCAALPSQSARTPRPTIALDTIAWHDGEIQWLSRVENAPERVDGPARAVARLTVELLMGGAVDPTEAHDVRDVRSDVPPALAQTLHLALNDASRASDVSTLARDLAATIGLPATSPRAWEGQSGVPRAAPHTRLRWLLAAALVIVLSTAAGVLLRRPTVASEFDDRPPDWVSREQALVLQGLAERGDALVRLDDFAGAAQAYDRMTAVSRAAVQGDSPAEAWAAARLAWVRHLAGDYAGEERYARLAIGMLDRTLEPSHPYQPVARVLLAMALGQAGRFDEAADLILDALSRRADAFGWRVAQTHANRGSLARAIQVSPVEFENDEDWMLDMFEACLRGSARNDPAQPDADADGIADIDEDDDGDGHADGLVYGLSFDPTRHIAHHGGVEPGLEGFWTRGRGDGHAVSTPIAGGRSLTGWRLASDTAYGHVAPLTSAQQRAAPAQGWRLLARVSLERGAALLSVRPHHTADTFEVGLARLSASTVTIEYGNARRVETLRVDAPLLVELRWDPGVRAVRLNVNEREITRKAAPSSAEHAPEIHFGVRGRADAPAAATFHAVLYEVRF